MGFSFVVLLVKLQQEPTPMPVTELFYNTPFFWLILLLTTPVITMRLFALEKFSGTFETLMTTPVSDLQVVLAKFTAALVFYVLMWLPLLGCLLIVRHYTNDAAALDAGHDRQHVPGHPVARGPVHLPGLLRLGADAQPGHRRHDQPGLRRQRVPAGLDRRTSFPRSASWQAQVLACFTFFEQMHDFARGVVDTRPVVLLGSLTLFFLFLTLRVVESRRWK